MNQTMTNNSFSWHRVGMVGRFYYPRLKWQIIFYPIVALFLSFCMMLFIKIKMPYLTLVPFSYALGMMFYLGPLIFINKSSREIETTLPATDAEKTTFMVLYSPIAIPLLALVPQYLMQYIMFGSLDISEQILDMAIPKDSGINPSMFTGMAAKNFFPNLMSGFAMVLICLCTVVTLKRQRIMMSVVFEFVTITVVGLIGCIWAIYIMFNTNFFGKIMETYPNQEAARDITNEFIVKSMPGVTWAICAAAIVGIAILIPMTYRGIKKFQI